VFPVFLLWVYFSWLVTLAAALVAANLKRSA
jgi:membrane protein